MFHHCNHPIRFSPFKHLELPRRCIVTWHLLAANSKLVENSVNIRSEYASDFCHNRKSAFKATFHLTISMPGQHAAGKIQKNNYHHGSCGPSLTGKTSSVSLIFTHGTHRNVKNRQVRSSLYSI